MSIHDDVKYVESKLSYWYGKIHAELLNIKDHLIMGDHQSGLTHLNKTLDFMDKNVVPEVYKTPAEPQNVATPPATNPASTPSPEPVAAAPAASTPTTPATDITL